MTDGRYVTGEFTCLDRCGNVILSDAVERRVVGYVGKSFESGEGSLLKDRERRISSKCQHEVIESEGKRVYVWNTERSLSQAVIPGGRLAKVEIAKREWGERVGDVEVGDLLSGGSQK